MANPNSDVSYNGGASGQAPVDLSPYVKKVDLDEKDVFYSWLDDESVINNLNAFVFIDNTDNSLDSEFTGRALTSDEIASIAKLKINKEVYTRPNIYASDEKDNSTFFDDLKDNGGVIYLYDGSLDNANNIILEPSDYFIITISDTGNTKVNNVYTYNVSVEQFGSVWNSNGYYGFSSYFQTKVLIDAIQLINRNALFKRDVNGEDLDTILVQDDTGRIGSMTYSEAKAHLGGGAIAPLGTLQRTANGAFPNANDKYSLPQPGNTSYISFRVANNVTKENHYNLYFKPGSIITFSNGCRIQLKGNRSVDKSGSNYNLYSSNFNIIEGALPAVGNSTSASLINYVDPEHLYSLLKHYFPGVDDDDTNQILRVPAYKYIDSASEIPDNPVKFDIVKVSTAISSGFTNFKASDGTTDKISLAVDDVYEYSGTVWIQKE